MLIKRNPAVQARGFQTYLNEIIHEWLQVLTVLGGTLIMLFLILDYFTAPREHFATFAVYRSITTSIIFAVYFILRNTKPSSYTYLYGYIISFIVSLMISIMTSDLGGFNSGYYAGLNLVIIAVNVLAPWQAIHSMINGVITVSLYVIINLLNPQEFQAINLINNLYFLLSMVVIAISISYVKHKLTKKEFESRSEVELTRDALWGEMEIAKKIQTALLPKKTTIGNYDVASLMVPADEVGGDYFDLIETRNGKYWVGIGDVSGHGVESGLIMMMAQTSIATAINMSDDVKPSQVLNEVNHIIKENISRLEVDRYMTLSLFQLENSYIVTAGRHQDLYIYRFHTRQLEKIMVKGTWIGVLEDIQDSNSDVIVPIGRDDVIFLFTDGVTEAANANREMFGTDRLMALFKQYAEYPVEEIVMKIYDEVKNFQKTQADDISLVILRNTYKWYSSKSNILDKIKAGSVLWRAN